MIKPRLTLLVISDGRLDYLRRTLQSFEENVGFDSVWRRVIVNDCPEPKFGAEVEALGFDEHVEPLDSRRGFAGAIQAGWAHLGECDYVLHLEDDFVFERPWDVFDVMQFLDRHPWIGQVALRRQAWNEREREAGGVIELWPDSFRDRHDDARGWHWLEHTLFWTTNPSIYSIEVTRDGWPQMTRSEEAFGQRLKNAGLVNAYWGKRSDDPWVTHIGMERVGTGY